MPRLTVTGDGLAAQLGNMCMQGAIQEEASSLESEPISDGWGLSDSTEEVVLASDSEDGDSRSVMGRLPPTDRPTAPADSTAA